MHSRRRLLLLVAAAAIGVPVWWWWSDRTPEPARPSAGRTVIAFGDSLVEGRGASPGRDFVSLLSRRLGTRVINAGRSGDTTATALTRLQQDVLSRDPKIVIVLLGGNDYLRGVPVDETFRNLRMIVERIRSRGAAVVLVGVSVGVLADPYAEQYLTIARSTSAGLVPDILDGLLGNRELMADSMHPNDRGYAIIAERLEPVLRELLVSP